MKPRRIHIERLQLNVEGVSAATARAAVAALGPALSAALRSAKIAPPSRDAPTHVSAAPLHVSTNPDSAALCAAIAQRVAGTLGTSANRSL